MASLKNLKTAGNLILCYMDDGSILRAYPTVGGLWLVNGDGGGTPPDPGAKTVIYPTDVHNVSDSFQDHVNRGSVNPGTDYTASKGSDVRAVADGVITDVTRTIGGSGGRMVHIDHTALGTGSDYLHLSNNDGVSVGQTVTQGQVIAKSGASGLGSENGYGAHLHISYRTVLGHAYTNFNSIDFDAYIKSL